MNPQTRQLVSRYASNANNLVFRVLFMILLLEELWGEENNEWNNRMMEILQRISAAFVFIYIPPSCDLVLPIFSSPVFLRAKRVPRVRGQVFWEYQHPSLPDDDSAGGFKAHYRLNRTTFNELMARLSTHPVYQFEAHNAADPAVQIGCVLWRFANAHLSYRQAEVLLGISHGSFHNFTERFLTALIDLEGRRIQWPTGELAEATAMKSYEGREISNDQTRHRLPGVIGAHDGKLVVIRKPGVVFWLINP